MKNKAPLSLMEQVIMILVFAPAAALCLQVFAFSDRSSRKNAAVDHAVLLCQNTAEALKATGSSAAHGLGIILSGMGGSAVQGGWSVEYDQNWQVTQGDCTYRLLVREVPAPVTGLAQAEIRVCDAAGEELFSLVTAWQEVSGHGA